MQKQEAKKYTPRPEASGVLALTAGQVARWFIETYKDEFDDPQSPIHGQSTDVWQHCVNLLQKNVRPDPSHPEAAPETGLHLKIVTIFEKEFLPLFRHVR